MGWVIERLKGAGLTALSVALMLGWWTLTGNGDGGVAADGPLPTLIGSGGRTLDVELSASQPVYLSATFECSADEDATIGREELAAGEHHFSFDVDGGCGYAVIESGMPEPQVGATMAWNVTVDGRPWQQESLTLDEPLEPGWAFGLQTGWEDAPLDELLAYRAEH